MRNLLLLLVVLISVASCKKDDITYSDDRKAAVQDAVRQVYDSLKIKLGLTEISPLSVLIQDGSGVYFATTGGMGDQKMTSGTFYRFASNTKNLTAVAIMKMAEEGWLDEADFLLDTIPGTDSTYIPSYWDFPYKEQITITQLLNHTAGVFDADNDNVDPALYTESFTEDMLAAQPDYQFTTDEYVSLLGKYELSYFAPGTGYHYSNTGYSMLAKIIERVYSLKNGEPRTYAQYVLNDLIPASGLNLDFKLPYLSSDQQLPTPYIKSYNIEDEGLQMNDLVNASPHLGEGNLVTTMSELNKYIRGLMKDQAFVNATTLNKMKNTTSSFNPGYGLGTTFTPNLGFGHNGATEGYLSLMAYDPETDVSVIATFPYWDMTTTEKFNICFMAMYDAAYAARKALGYSGKP